MSTQERRVVHIKARAVKQESDGGYYRVSFFAGIENQTLAHSGDLLLKPEEWEVLYWKLMQSTMPEGVYQKFSVQGALPPLRIS
jgi:hypothetical protein